MKTILAKMTEVLWFFKDFFPIKILIFVGNTHVAWPNNYWVKNLKMILAKWLLFIEFQKVQDTMILLTIVETSDSKYFLLFAIQDLWILLLINRIIYFVFQWLFLALQDAQSWDSPDVTALEISNIILRSKMRWVAQNGPYFL